MTHRPSRREVLAAGAALAARGALPWRPASPIERVVLVVFGGGVRTRETLDGGDVPHLRRLADEGTVYANTRVENVGHYGATLSILTGRFEYLGIRENEPVAHPTLFELVRRHAGLPASEVWLAASGGVQEKNYAHGRHPDYGARYGANLVGGEGLFNVELREVLGDAARLGSPEDEALLARLRGAVRTPLPVVAGEELANDPETLARMEGYILDELRGGLAELTGLAANDRKALRVARNLLTVFRPRLLVVTLREADVAHGSYNDYVETIRRNDRELGALADAVRQDPGLAGSTAILVLPEFGRDRDLNARRGLDHGDSSTDLLRVALVAWGPGIPRGRTETREIRSIDVAPTILSHFGVRAGRGIRGEAIAGLRA